MNDIVSPPKTVPNAGTSPVSIGSEWNDDCECLHPDAVAAARAALGRSVPVDDLSLVFTMLGDPTRLRVLIALGGAELCVMDLAAATGVNRTTISHQLRVLRGQRLVRRRRDGKVVYYALDDDHVSALLTVASAHLGESGTPATDERASA